MNGIGELVRGVHETSKGFVGYILGSVPHLPHNTTFQMWFHGVSQLTNF
jgi:hypothetical protein